MSSANIDIIDISEGKDHKITFLLWPRLWQTYSSTHTWTKIQLNMGNLLQIPEDSGIYFLFLDPEYSAYSQCSHLMYIGETSNLRTRFLDYLTSERQNYGRPHMVKFLINYDPYIYFCFTLVALSNRARVRMEDDMIDAYTPPINKKIKGRHGAIVRAVL